MEPPRVRARTPRSASRSLALLLLLFSTSAAGAEPVRRAGRPLAEVLLELRDHGLRIVFASNVVRPEMTVVAEPLAVDPPALLEELLAPHGLAARTSPGGAIVVVPVVQRQPVAGAAIPEPPADPLQVSGFFEEELVVTPSRIELLEGAATSEIGLSRAEILALPHLGDDVFRALSLLPGAAGTDVSAEIHVRGGRRDETQIRLDGQELFDVFHLKDYDDAVSVVAPATLAGADLMTGGFSAEYGDRMSGVLDLRTLSPSGGARYRLGLGILGVDAGGGGSFDDGGTNWIVELRRGSLDLVQRLLDAEDPEYWDAFAKLGARLGPRHSLTVSGLHAEDSLDFTESDGGETKRFDTDYSSSHGWFNLQTFLGSSLLVETAGAAAAIDRDRRGAEVEEEGDFAVHDLRDSEVLELRQGWDYQASGRQALEWGWQWREIETDYDYLGRRNFDTALAELRHDGGVGTVVFRDRLRERHSGLWLTDRLRPVPALSLELGVRYDRYAESREEHASPRVNVAWSFGRGGVVRAAWGRFDQSQRPYELQVEDGETELFRVERSTHEVLSFEIPLGAAGSTHGTLARLELYRRRLADPRPRYEDLFEPVNVFPEVEEGRVLVAADRSEARGAELFLRGDRGGRFRWWLDYVWSETEDEIDGRWTPRSFDQTHALNVDFDVALGTRWRLNLAWRWHTGWPTTALSTVAVEDEEGETEFVPVLGPRNAERLADYHRLDLRASRSWTWRRAAVELYFDVQNAYDRQNVAGYDMEIDEEDGSIAAQPEAWPGILVSGGITLEF